MKIILLSILLLTTFAGYSQFNKKKKAKKEAEKTAEQAANIDPKDAVIDSLSTVNLILTTKLDSVTKIEKQYYNTLKEKVLITDFDPNRLGLIIDSIRAAKDKPTTLVNESSGSAKNAVLVLGEPSVSLRDSLAVMTHENKILTSKVDSMELEIHTIERKIADKVRLVSELKDLKGLLDSKLISQADYESKKKLVMDKWQ